MIIAADEMMISPNLRIGRDPETVSSAFSSAATATVTATSDAKVFEAPPSESTKLVFFNAPLRSKLYEPVFRAFHSRGWSITEDEDRAHVLWFTQPDGLQEVYEDVHLWQRVNQLPHTDQWDDKDKLALHMNQYYKKSGRKPLHSFPETYILNRRNDMIEFQKRLKKQGGLDLPWVLKLPTVNEGKGVQIVAPQSQKLKALADMKVPRQEDFGERLIAQQYICNELTYSGRKFDFRVFWMVASVDPLVVLYHTGHNYVRIGQAKYDESNFTDTLSHLTTHTFGAEEKKATWDEFKVYIEEFQSIQGDRLAHLSEDPFGHVQNQIMQALAHLVDAYRDVTFHPNDFESQNAFSVHAADMLVDNDLDVFVIEGTDGPGKDEDYDFRIAMHNSIFGEMVDIFEEVTDRQAKGLPVDVKDMEERGILGDYKVIIDRDWTYEYKEYEQRRVKNKIGCNHDKQVSTVNSNVSLVNVAEKAKTTAHPKEITAAGFDLGAVPNKPFYMEGRTGRKGEMVTRSFRRNGWTPVDSVEFAKIVYDRKRPEVEKTIGPLFDRKLSPWQFYNHFPMAVEDPIFAKDNILKYTDTSDAELHVCNPILYKGRRFTIVTYMMVVSWDPLIVYYHDGYLDIPYSEEDELEFLKREDGSRVWRGAWENIGSMAKAAAKHRNDVADPLQHVTSQLKQTLVNVGAGLASEIVSALHNYSKNSAQPHYYGLYKATFEMDRNMTTFLTDIENWKLVYGESYQEIVDLHDELYGSMFQMLESVNATMSAAQNSGNAMTSEALTEATKNARGRYELLIHDPTVGSHGNAVASASSPPWKFEYPLQSTAPKRECTDTQI
ncbi:MAG: hypothetical protein SGILL_006428 [Bacillariaceae sp.]